MKAFPSCFTRTPAPFPSLFSSPGGWAEDCHVPGALGGISSSSSCSVLVWHEHPGLAAPQTPPWPGALLVPPLEQSQGGKFVVSLALHAGPVSQVSSVVIPVSQVPLFTVCKRSRMLLENIHKSVTVTTEGWNGLLSKNYISEELVKIPWATDRR